VRGPARIVRGLIIGTRFDPLARRVWKALHQPRSEMALRSQWYDGLTLAVMDRIILRACSCIDVGSFAGSLLSEMLKRAPEGTQYALEPLPEMAARLRRRFRRSPSVHIIEAAAADFSGTATFYHVTTHPGYSGLRPRRYDYPHEQVRPIQVRVVRLDDVVPVDVPIKLIKIDVEGGELGVLRGCTRIIRRWLPYIVFEHGDAADRYGTRASDVYDLLTGSLKMNISTLDAWLKGEAPFSRGRFIDHLESQADYYFLAHP
jgi:FkbM family methyltransferase